MVINYLEKEITKELEKNKIIKELSPRIFYKPEHKGETYRKGRQLAIKHAPTIMLGATGICGATIGATAYFVPEMIAKVGAGIGAAGLLGVLAKSVIPADKFLYSNPKDIARRYFKSVDVPWNEAYGQLNIKDKKSLEGFVYMAQTPTAVKEEFHHHDAQVTLGVTIAKMADLLSEINFDGGRKIQGLSEKDLIKMMSLQKIGNQKDTETIKELTQKYSASSLLKKIRKGKSISIPGLSTLENHLYNYEFALRISEADALESIGSQISKGHLFVTNAVGPNAGCYAGMHSKKSDCPRISIGDDAGHSLLTHAKKGIAVVGGNAEQGVLDRATGGIAIIEGYAEHNFAHDMDDSTWPAIAISVGGTTEEVYKDKVKNGLVISLNKNRTMIGKPTAYRFRDGEMHKEMLSGDETDKAAAANIAKEYIRDWAVKNFEENPF